MRVKWVRGNHNFNYRRPDVWFAIGVRGSGKSSFLEDVGMKYLDEGAVVCDIFGSKDGEGLAWLRSPYAKDKRILLLKGENVDVTAPCEVKSVSLLKPDDLERYDIIILSSPLFSTLDSEFYWAGKLTDLLYSRVTAKRLIYGICREAANFYYSRLKITENQTLAKANMIYLIRESRHMWLGLGLDSIRYYAIDIDIRTLTDFMVIKSQGLQGLSKDLKWLYSYVEPYTIRNLRPNQFIMLTNRGAIGYGAFPKVEWHKREKEDIMGAVGIKVEKVGEEPKESITRGTFVTVSDREHAEMISLYIAQNLSLKQIAKKLKRSSATPMNHIDLHNEAIDRSGFCSSCKRVSSIYAEEKAVPVIQRKRGD